MKLANPFRPRIKPLPLALALIAVVAASGVLHAVNRSRMDLAELEFRTRAVIDRAESLAQRAAAFDHEQALRNLGTNPINGPVYRFDERWRDAEIALTDDIPTTIARSPAEAGIRFDFESSDTHRFDPDYSEFTLAGGTLSTRYAPGTLLRTLEPLELPWDDVASVRFRMKLDRGENVELAFARGLVPERTRVYEPQFGVITVEVIPDGEFHTYEVNASDAFEYQGKAMDKVQRLFFRPSNVEGDEVEIDFIQIIPRREKYTERPFGMTYETLALDARPVLYSATPLALTFEVDVPENAPRLRFGLGILDEGDPVSFTISLDDGDDPVELFTEMLDWRDAWSDRSLDLEPWAGRSVALTFTATSQQGNIAFWSNPLLSGDPARRFNVVLLLEDTLRADHLSIYGYERETSPVKARLASDAVIFDTVFAQSTETRPSCPSMMTSLYPTSTGVWNFTDRLNERYVTLAEVLRSQGFETAAFIQNNHAGRVAGLHRGYSHFHEKYSLDSGPSGIYGERMTDWLDQVGDRNFFLYLHVLDPHDPYEPEAAFDIWSGEPSRENPGQPQQGFELDRNKYDGEILANDHYFGRFIERLDAMELLEDTLIVFLSDHGEYFGEHGGLSFHVPPAFSQVLHVPLMLHYPNGLPGNLRVSTPAGLIDVMPTILELAQVRPDELLLQGDSLLPIIRGDTTDPRRLVLSDDVRDMNKGERFGWASFLFGRWHVLNSRRFVDSTGRTAEPRLLPQSLFLRVYDYGHDPEENFRARGFSADPLIKRRLQRLMHDVHEANMKIWEAVSRGERDESAYDAETLQRLRDLGYVQ